MNSILIVEDDPWYAAQQQRVLSGAGYESHQANDPHVAMKMIERRLPAAIILDILLAYNTAFVLLHELQSSQETAAIPVIVCTTQADLLEESNLQAYGIVSVLDKATMHPGDTVRVLRRIGV